MVHSEMVELIVTAGAEIDEPIAQPPTSYEFHFMIDMFSNYSQWQYVVTADHLNMFHKLQAAVADTTAPKL